MAALRFGQPAIVRPQTRHTATIIFLHGLGDSGQNLSMLSHSFRLPYVKWVFPSAPTRPISVNGGMPMPGWFDIAQFDKLAAGSVDHGGIRESCDYLGKLVQQEVDAGIPVSRIVVGGFSQGGHVAVKHAISTAHPLPGCVMLSTWLEPGVSTQVPPANQKTRFFIGHGTADPLIPGQMAAMSEKVLEQKGCTHVVRKMYPGMQHSTCAQELDDVKDFLLSVIPEEETKPPTSEEIEAMSIKELRQYLSSMKIDSNSFLEKSEFVAAAKQTL